jgi:hypothetical protein
MALKLQVWAAAAAELVLLVVIPLELLLEQAVLAV